MKPLNFEIDFLDHVAIVVRDLEASVAWYEKVLGLKRKDIKEWGGFPIFLLAGKTGLALFPAKLDDPELNHASGNVKIDHFAFNVSNANFQKARKHYDELGLAYTVKDHIYYHSMYTRDPDGHTVELTTLMVDANDFY